MAVPVKEGGEPKEVMVVPIKEGGELQEGGQLLAQGPVWQITF